MHISANDWASPNPNQNMTLAEADSFANALTAALLIQIVGKFVKTTGGNIISEKELRGNQFLSPLPVNLYTQIAGANNAEFNIAEMRANLKAIAQSDDPVGGFIDFLRGAFQTGNPFAYVTRIPAVMRTVADALAKV